MSERSVSAMLGELTERMKKVDAFSCLKALRDRKAKGEKLSPAQEDFLKRVRMSEIDDGATGTHYFTPPPLDVLPPAMREYFERVGGYCGASQKGANDGR